MDVDFGFLIDLLNVGASNWQQNETQYFEMFVRSNRFFKDFYRRKNLEDIAAMCYVRVLNEHQILLLQNNNRPQAIILLSGVAAIFKKQPKHTQARQVVKGNAFNRIKNGKNQQEPETDPPYDKDDFSALKAEKDLQTSQQNDFIFFNRLQKSNQTVQLNCQCLVKSAVKSSVLLYVPCCLYNVLIGKIESEKFNNIMSVLQKFFPKLSSKDLKEISSEQEGIYKFNYSFQASCTFRQFKMNSSIYSALQKPCEVYILLQGMVKLEKPGFSQKSLEDTELIYANTLFGNTDFEFNCRLKSAVSCSLHSEIFVIPKRVYFRIVNASGPGDDSKVSVKLPLIQKKPLKTTGGKNSNSYDRVERQRQLQLCQKINVENKCSKGGSVQFNSQKKGFSQLFRSIHVLVDVESSVKRSRTCVRRFLSGKKPSSSIDISRLPVPGLYRSQNIPHNAFDLIKGREQSKQCQ